MDFDCNSKFSWMISVYEMAILVKIVVKDYLSMQFYWQYENFCTNTTFDSVNSET